jgi:thioredoxin-dependent peroxiredoxin
MRLSVGQPLPVIDLTDHRGEPNVTCATNRWMLLGVLRTAGCPVCSLRFHELSREAKRLDDLELDVVCVFGSTRAEVVTAVSGTELARNVFVVADPDAQLYERLGIEKSSRALVRGLGHGLIAKERAGKRLLTGRGLTDNGPLTQMGADFLVSPAGVVAAAHYWRWPGDHLDLSSVQDIIGGVR